MSNSNFPFHTSDMVFPTTNTVGSFIEFFNDGLHLAYHYGSLPKEYREISEKLGKIIGSVYGDKFENVFKKIHDEIGELDSPAIARTIDDIEFPNTFGIYDVLIDSGKYSVQLVSTSRKLLGNGVEFGARLYSFKEDESQLNIVVPFYKGIENPEFTNADFACKESLIQSFNYEERDIEECFVQALFLNLCTKTATFKKFLDIDEASRFMLRLEEFWGLHQV